MVDLGEGLSPLRIHGLAAGDCFCVVSSTRVRNVRDFIELLLASAARRTRLPMQPTQPRSSSKSKGELRWRGRRATLCSRTKTWILSQGIVRIEGQAMKTMNVRRLTATIGVVLLGCLARLDEPGGAFAQQCAVALLTGRVINEAGDLLAGATVVVATPAADMRDVHPGSGHTTYSTKTDQDGRYAVRIPVGDGGGSIAVNAMLKGYQTAAGYQAAAGTMMGGGDRRQARVFPGDVVAASFVLQPAAYVAGIVVDEHGGAVSGVEVTGLFRRPVSDGYVATTKTNAKGRFEVFDFPLGGAYLKELEATGELEFKHSLFQEKTLADVYALSANERQELRIVLSKGHSISGTLLDENDNPSAGAMVEMLFGDDITKRVAVEADHLGRFHFSGLPAAKSVKLFSYALQRRVSASQRDARPRPARPGVEAGTLATGAETSAHRVS